MGLSDFPTVRRSHPLKRRKISHTPQNDPTASSTSLPTGIPPQPPVWKVPICTSCHRAFPGAKQTQLVECARCHAPTCTICSRTCNGCPPSVPPTPDLTNSASEPDTPLMSPFPFPAARRPALALNTNTALAVAFAGATPPPPLAGRRRKARERDEDEDEWTGDDGDGDVDLSGDKGGKGDGGVLPGCGRVVCRTCSFETPESDLTTCYDCAGRSPVEA